MSLNDSLDIKYLRELKVIRQNNEVLNSILRKFLDMEFDIYSLEAKVEEVEAELDSERRKIKILESSNKYLLAENEALIIKVTKLESSNDDFSDYAGGAFLEGL